MSVSLFVDAHVFDKEYQGTRTFIKGLYTELAGYADVKIFMAANDIENLKQNFPSENIVFIKYRTTSSFSRLLFEIPAIIKKYKIDYAHFQYVIPPIKKCKFIVTTHDIVFCDYPKEFSWHYRLVRKYFFKHSVLRADVVTTVSKYSKYSIQKHFKISAKKISVVSNGIAEKFFNDYDRNCAKKYVFEKYGLKKYILFVSRIEPRKNHVLLLNAFLELKLYEKGFHLAFIGKHSLKDERLNETLHNLPGEVKRFVFISDKICDEELIHFYCAADLFVYPSKAEGFGIPPLEAAALKTPVLCSNTSAMSDFYFFENQQINPFNYEEFTIKLLNSIEKKPDEKKLNEIAQIIKEKYSWKNSAKQFYQLLQCDSK